MHVRASTYSINLDPSLTQTICQLHGAKWLNNLSHSPLPKAKEGNTQARVGPTWGPLLDPELGMKLQIAASTMTAEIIHIPGLLYYFRSGSA